MNSNLTMEFWRVLTGVADKAKLLLVLPALAALMAVGLYFLPQDVRNGFFDFVETNVNVDLRSMAPVACNVRALTHDLSSGNAGASDSNERRMRILVARLSDDPDGIVTQELVESLADAAAAGNYIIGSDCAPIDYSRGEADVNVDLIGMVADRAERRRARRNADLLIFGRVSGDGLARLRFHVDPVRLDSSFGSNGARALNEILAPPIGFESLRFDFNADKAADSEAGEALRQALGLSAALIAASAVDRDDIHRVMLDDYLPRLRDLTVKLSADSAMKPLSETLRRIYRMSMVFFIDSTESAELAQSLLEFERQHGALVENPTAPLSSDEAADSLYAIGKAQGLLGSLERDPEKYVEAIEAYAASLDKIRLGRARLVRTKLALADSFMMKSVLTDRWSPMEIATEYVVSANDDVAVSSDLQSRLDAARVSLSAGSLFLLASVQFEAGLYAEALSLFDRVAEKIDASETALIWNAMTAFRCMARVTDMITRSAAISMAAADDAFPEAISDCRAAEVYFRNANAYSADQLLLFIDNAEIFLEFLRCQKSPEECDRDALRSRILSMEERAANPTYSADSVAGTYLVMPVFQVLSARQMAIAQIYEADGDRAQEYARVAEGLDKLIETIDRQREPHFYSLVAQTLAFAERNAAGFGLRAGQGPRRESEFRGRLAKSRRLFNEVAEIAEPAPRPSQYFLAMSQLAVIDRLEGQLDAATGGVKNAAGLIERSDRDGLFAIADEMQFVQTVQYAAGVTYYSSPHVMMSPVIPQ